MELDTPLTEVAHFLTPEMAEQLLWETPDIQVRILELVRSYIIALEQHLVVDPITLGMYTSIVVRAELEEVRNGRPATGPGGSILP